jgi:predicted RNase H-like HicB family nuclease
MRVTAKATRSAGWWAIEVPEIPGLYTQVRRLDQVESMVKDAVTLMTGQALEVIDVAVEPVLPSGESAAVSTATAARAALRQAEAEAAAANRRAVSQLAKQGLTVRDIGTILGVSPQRAHHILKATA